MSETLHYREYQDGCQYVVATNDFARITVPLEHGDYERTARALHVLDHGPWVSGQGLTEGGTPWGTSREADRHDAYLKRARAFFTLLAGTVST
jgi:hypothetical protein